MTRRSSKLFTKKLNYSHVFLRQQIFKKSSLIFSLSSDEEEEEPDMKEEKEEEDEEEEMERKLTELKAEEVAELKRYARGLLYSFYSGFYFYMQFCVNICLFIEKRFLTSIQLNTNVNGDLVVLLIDSGPNLYLYILLNMHSDCLLLIEIRLLQLNFAVSWRKVMYMVPVLITSQHFNQLGGRGLAELWGAVTL